MWSLVILLGLSLVAQATPAKNELEQTDCYVRFVSVAHQGGFLDQLIAATNMNTRGSLHTDYLTLVGQSLRESRMALVGPFTRALSEALGGYLRGNFYASAAMPGDHYMTYFPLRSRAPLRRSLRGETLSPELLLQAMGELDHRNLLCDRGYPVSANLWIQNLIEILNHRADAAAL